MTERITGELPPDPAASSEPVPPPGTWTVVGTGSRPGDEQLLRDVLGADFDRHAQSAAAALAAHPSLTRSRAGDPWPGLIALSAHLGGLAAQIDGTLRHEPGPGASAAAGRQLDPAEARELARCVQEGLARFPARVGPVTAPAGAAQLSHKAGRTLVEPGFAAALIDRTPRIGPPVALVIWSLTGRRTDWLTRVAGPASGGVLFPAGTRFAVLGSEPARVDGPARVLLAELAAGERELPADVAERTRARLLEFDVRAAAGVTDPVPVPSTLGVHADGVPFTPPEPVHGPAARPSPAAEPVPAGAGR